MSSFRTQCSRISGALLLSAVALAPVQSHAVTASVSQAGWTVVTSGGVSTSPSGSFVPVSWSLDAELNGSFGGTIAGPSFGFSLNPGASVLVTSKLNIDVTLNHAGEEFDIWLPFGSAHVCVTEPVRHCAFVLIGPTAPYQVQDMPGGQFHDHEPSFGLSWTNETTEQQSVSFDFALQYDGIAVAVPEPSSVALLLAGLGGVAIRRRSGAFRSVV